METPPLQPAGSSEPETIPNADRLILVDEHQDSSNGRRTEQALLGEDRLLVLCDGVFAIAATLLVLDIKLPVDEIHNEGDFNAHLVSLLSSQVVIYAITFAVIAGYWSQHRRIVRQVERVDARFTWLTFLFLAFVAFFPVTSSVLNDYAYRGAVILYTLGMAGCGFSLVALWLYAAWDGRLLDHPVPRGELTIRVLFLALAPTYFCLTLLLLLTSLHPTDVFWFWLLLPVLYRFIQWGIGKRQARKETNPDH